jgi:tetratricopeptide (TPR) repeat protein
MPEENPGIDRQKIEQSMFKGAFFSGNPTFGDMRQTVNIHPQLPPPLTSTPSNLPFIGTNHFLGREESLKQVHNALAQGERVAITAVVGMGGVGKTELAIQYAQRHKRGYSAGLAWFFVRAGDVGVQILNFASSFGLVPPDDPDPLVRVRFIWQHWPVRPASMVEAKEPGDVLLVFDDVPSEQYRAIAPYLPLGNPRFKVLLTTREQLGDQFRAISLDVLSLEDALALLGALEGHGRVDRELAEAEELCRRLGYLPLGIELVGRYLAKKPDVTLAEMLVRLEQNGLSTKALEKAQSGMTAQVGVRAVFELSWQELDEQGKEVAYLLGLFALAPVPWRLVESCLSDWDNEELEDVRDEQLRKLSLLERSREGLYRLHPLIREYFGEKILEFVGVEELKRGYCRVMVSQANSFSRTPIRQQWEGFAPVVPHLAEVADRLLEWVEDEDLASVFTGLGKYYGGQGAYSQAGHWDQWCLDECRTRLGEEHQDTLISINNLAQTLFRQGDYGGARQRQEQVIEVSRRVLGEEHPLTLTSINSLAQTLYFQGDYGGARKLQEQVLEVRRRVLAEEHPDTLTSIGDLASTLYSQGDYVGARQLQQQVSEAYRRVLGEENPDTLASIGNLASTLYSQGDYAGARSLQEQVLEVLRRVLGEAHPHTSGLMGNLALTLYSQGNYEGARQLQEQVSEAYRRVLGEAHPHTLTSIGNLALTLYSQGDYGRARSLQEQVLEVRRRVLGEAHPDTLSSIYNLVLMLKSQGDYEQAEPLYVQAVETSMSVLGRGNPTTATFLQSYFGFLRDIFQHHPDVLLKLLFDGSEITKQILEKMQKDKELSNPTQEG